MKPDEQRVKTIHRKLEHAQQFLSAATMGQMLGEVRDVIDDYLGGALPILYLRFGSRAERRLFVVARPVSDEEAEREESGQDWGTTAESSRLHVIDVDATANGSPSRLLSLALDVVIISEVADLRMLAELAGVDAAGTSAANRVPAQIHAIQGYWIDPDWCYGPGSPRLHQNPTDPRNAWAQRVTHANRAATRLQVVGERGRLFESMRGTQRYRLSPEFSVHLEEAVRQKPGPLIWKGEKWLPVCEVLGEAAVLKQKVETCADSDTPTNAEAVARSTCSVLYRDPLNLFALLAGCWCLRTTSHAPAQKQNLVKALDFGLKICLPRLKRMIEVADAMNKSGADKLDMNMDSVKFITLPYRKFATVFEQCVKDCVAAISSRHVTPFQTYQLERLKAIGKWFSRRQDTREARNQFWEQIEHAAPGMSQKEGRLDEVAVALATFATRLLEGDDKLQEGETLADAWEEWPVKEIPPERVWSQGGPLDEERAEGEPDIDLDEIVDED